MNHFSRQNKMNVDSLKRVANHPQTISTADGIAIAFDKASLFRAGEIGWNFVESGWLNSEGLSRRWTICVPKRDGLKIDICKKNKIN
jgi:hypothetical protein